MVSFLYENTQKANPTKKKKKINKTNVILSILLVLSASVFIYSLLNIRNWKKDNDETEKEVESIYKTVSVEEVTEGENVNAESQKKESIYWSYIKMNMINVDFTELLKQNSDTKGWIQVNGTNINYPFVQSNDNAYYLNHSFTFPSRSNPLNALTGNLSPSKEFIGFIIFLTKSVLSLKCLFF